MLRHTAEQAQLHLGTRMLEAGEIAQTPQHPLFGVLANRTRIQEDDVGQLGARRRRITRALKNRAHELRVCDIHLAAVRFDIYARLRRLVCGFGRGNELNLRLWAVRDTTSIGEGGWPRASRVRLTSDGTWCCRTAWKVAGEEAAASKCSCSSRFDRHQRQQPDCTT